MEFPFKIMNFTQTVQNGLKHNIYYMYNNIYRILCIEYQAYNTMQMIPSIEYYEQNIVHMKLEKLLQLGAIFQSSPYYDTPYSPTPA